MKITMKWGDGEYDFNLKLGQIRELQQKTGVGPYKLYERVRSHEWLVDDLRETLRLGLIGGGMENVKALQLIENNFDERSKIQQEEPVIRILINWLVGEKDDEEVGKSKAVEDKNEQTASSPSPQSMEQVQ